MKWNVIMYRVPTLASGEEPFPGVSFREIPVVAIDAAWATYFAMKMVTDASWWMPAATKEASRDGLNIFVRLKP